MAWRVPDASMRYEYARRGHEGWAGGVVFFGGGGVFFWRVVIAVLGCQRRDEVTMRFTHAPIFFGGGRPGVEPPSSGRGLQRPSRQAGPVGEPRVLHGLVGLFSFGPGIFHPWVNGYGDCWNIPIPAYPMGEGFGPFMYRG